MEFIRSTGHMELWGTPCIYVDEGDKLIVVPKNEEDYISQPSNLLGHDFEISYSGSKYFLTTAHICDVIGGIGKEKELSIKYTFKKYHNKLFDGMRITGCVLDDFFQPSKYFFNKARENNLPKNNLIYTSEIAESWDIPFEGQLIHIELSYGDILRKGIASDLKLHPILTIKFNQTSDTEYIYQMYLKLLQFFRIVRYNPCCGPMRIEMLCSQDSGCYVNGFLIDYSEKGQYCGADPEINYDMYKPCMKRLLELAFSNANIFTEHYPENGSRRIVDGYLSADYAKIFSAFENECHANSLLYEKADTSQINKIKSNFLEYMDQFEPPESNENNEEFMQEAKGRIRQLGTQFGQRKKIANAYMKVSGALTHSLKSILCGYNVRIASVLEEAQIKEISKELVDIRGKIVHGDYSGAIPFDKCYAVRLLEVVTYSMLLKRAGLTDDEIERTIGPIFNCNTIYMDKLCAGE